MRIGFMQGRLSKIERNRIQSFPFKNWINEFSSARKHNFKLIEWTIDSFNIDKNPILTKSGIKKIIGIKKKTKVNIDSITCDFFMENPFFKKKKEQIKFFKIFKRSFNKLKNFRN